MRLCSAAGHTGTLVMCRPRDMFAGSSERDQASLPWPASLCGTQWLLALLGPLSRAAVHVVYAFLVDLVEGLRHQRGRESCTVSLFHTVDSVPAGDPRWLRLLKPAFLPILHWTESFAPSFYFCQCPGLPSLFDNTTTLPGFLVSKLI